MDDTWMSRDLPVLEAVVTWLDTDFSEIPQVYDIAERTGLSSMDVARAVKAMDGLYLELQLLGGGPEGWAIRKVYPAARFAVGQWPTGEALIDHLVEGLGRAADTEPDPEKRERLKKAASWLGTGLRDTAANVAGAYLAHVSQLG
jgi:hypothetical protein